MESFPVLSLITFLPLVGVLFILIVRGDEETVAKNARSAAMWASSSARSSATTVGYEAATSRISPGSLFRS